MLKEKSGGGSLVLVYEWGGGALETNQKRGRQLHRKETSERKAHTRNHRKKSERWRKGGGREKSSVTNQTLSLSLSSSLIYLTLPRFTAGPAPAAATAPCMRDEVAVVAPAPATASPQDPPQGVAPGGPT